MAIKYPKGRVLGAPDVQNFPKVQYAKIKEIIDVVNDLTDGSISTTDLTLSGDLIVGDDATITGDLGVTGVATLGGTADMNGTELILDADADTSITADTDDQIDIKVAGADDFTITANTFTALSGSSIATNTITETTAASGVTIDGVLVKDSSVTLADGLVSNLAVKIGADANNGIYGISDTQMGFAVEGVLVGGANTTGLFADVISEQTSTLGVTIDGTLIKDGSAISKAVITSGTATSVASGGSITAAQLAGGIITATGATGNWQLPDWTDIVTAIPSLATAGNTFSFIFNAQSMTATNTATLVVGSNFSVPSAPAITGGATLTVTQDTQVEAMFTLVCNGATGKIYRVF